MKHKRNWHKDVSYSQSELLIVEVFLESADKINQEYERKVLEDNLTNVVYRDGLDTKSLNNQVYTN